jgi:signal transduction histidine kinase
MRSTAPGVARNGAGPGVDPEPLDSGTDGWPESWADPAREEEIRQLTVSVHADAGLADIVTIAASICGTRSAAVTLVEREHTWSPVSIGGDTTATDNVGREHSFCARAMRGDDVMVVSDARTDSRFADNPMVAGAPYIRFYAGAPLISTSGHELGSLCVTDPEPHALSDHQRAALRALSRQVTTQWEMQRDARRLACGMTHYGAIEKAKDDLLGLLGHHLRTPLTSMRTLLELFNDDADLDPATAALLSESIRSNSDRLLRLFDNLALMAQHGGGDGTGLGLAHDHVDLSALVEDAVRTIQPLADDRAITISLGTEERVVVRGDATRLRHAVGHLGFNAVRFTEPGGAVRLSAFPLPVPTVEVSDTGIGIPLEQQPSLLDPLRCLGSETHPEEHQALAAVNAIVYAHRGVLTLESKPGAGATFRLALPAGQL